MVNSLQNSPSRKFDNIRNSTKKITTTNPEFGTFRISNNKPVSESHNRREGISPENYEKNKLFESTRGFQETKPSFFSPKDQYLNTIGSNFNNDKNTYGLSPFEN